MAAATVGIFMNLSMRRLTSVFLMTDEHCTAFQARGMREGWIALLSHEQIVGG
jgi:hypothetical protein